MKPQKSLLLPPALPVGGRLGVVSPASPPSAVDLESGTAALVACGFQVEWGRHVLDRHGHLAGADLNRAADLHEMFERSDIDAVICSRGGAGSIRLLNLIDWGLIARHPKPFIGYSDITVLELAMLRQCGLVTFFAPMVASEFGPGLAAASSDFLWKLVCRPRAAGAVVDDRCSRSTCLVPGEAAGPLAGGTLSLVAATLGTPAEIDLEGALFFFEDVDEPPEHIERYLCQLIHSGRLEQVAGFLIGNAPWAGEERALTLHQIYEELLAPFGRPMLYGWPHGHDEHPLALPMGIHARLDSSTCSLEILEPAVAPRPESR